MARDKPVIDDEPPILPYATPDAEGCAGHSRYGWAAVAVLAADFVWFFLPGPFDYQKHFRVFAIAWLLGLILTVAGYLEHRQSRALGLLAVVLIVVDFFLTALLPSY